MKSKKRTLPRDKSYDERAIALAIRLGLIDPPTGPISEITEPGWKRLWFAIGQELADKEPEFQWGPGRRPGSKSKKPRLLSDNVSPDTIRKRRSRQKKRDPKLGSN